MIAYWQGKLPLQISLWVLFIGLMILITFLEFFLIEKLISNPNQGFIITTVSLLITRFIIFPWQLVGLFRATEKDYIKNGNTLKTRSIQTVMILTVLFTLVYILGSIPVISYFNKTKTHLLATDNKQSEYTLKLAEHGQHLYISRIFDFGITDAVRNIIEENPKLSTIILESNGGHVYEGRGLSKLITKHGLDTYSYMECSSACATAFIGGKNRYLGESGKIGFHRYKMENPSFWYLMPLYDIESEHEKDLELFKSQGVKQAFLKKIFEQTTDEMWFPNHAELLEASVIHPYSPTKASK